MTANKKHVIEEVITSEETLAALDFKLKKSYVDKHRIIRNYIGGCCASCRGIPSRKVIYDVGDGNKLVEFYCDPCFEKDKSKLDKRLQNINFT